MENIHIHDSDFKNAVNLFIDGYLARSREASRQEREEAANRAQALQDQLREMRVRVGRVDELQAENAQLRNTLAAQTSLGNSSRPQADQHDQTLSSVMVDDSPHSGNARTVPYEDYRRLTEKYEDLTTRHENMKTQAATYKKRSTEGAIHIAKQKARIDRWKEYILEVRNYNDKRSKRLACTSGRLESVEPPVPFDFTSSAILEPAAQDRSSRPDAHITEEGVIDVPRTTLGTVEEERDALGEYEEGAGGDEDILDRPRNVAALQEPSSSDRATRMQVTNPSELAGANPSSDTTRAPPSVSVFTPRLHRSSSQTTEDDGAMGLSTTIKKPLRTRERSSSPIVVSTRMVKRKRPDDQRAATVDAVQRIKPEDHSSPLRFVGFTHLDHNESLDLDDLEGSVETPRKRRNMPLQKRLSSQRPIRCISVPIEPSNILAADDMNPRLISSFNDPASEGKPMVEDSQEEPVVLSERRARHNRSSAVFNPRRTESNVLQPLDANNQILRRTGIVKPRPKRRARASSQAIQDVAEDGETATSRPTPEGPNTTKKKPGPARIEGLLETPPLANKHTLLAPRTLTPRSTTASGLRKSRLREPPTTETYGIDDVRPEQEPLRARPLNRLSLDDFKVNPRANQGLDYAFSESVRKKDLRHCLPGCTRPECCGDVFRKMAEIGGPIATTTPARRPIFDSSSPISQDGDAEENRLLLPFLNNDKSRLGRLLPAERNELLIRARAAELAQKHGRHRQAYARAASPPGFWNVDMPTTQEMEADATRARALVRERVRERWEEAVKPGGAGKWMFRDE